MSAEKCGSRPHGGDCRQKSSKKRPKIAVPQWGNARHFSKMNFPSVFGSVLHSVEFSIASPRRVSAGEVHESWPPVVRETVPSPGLHRRSRRVLSTVRLRDTSELPRKRPKNVQKLRTPMEECSQFLKNDFSDRFWVPFALCGCGIQHRVSSSCFPPRSRRVLATGRPRDRLLAVSPPKTSTSPEHRSSEKRVTRRWIGLSFY